MAEQPRSERRTQNRLLENEALEARRTKTHDVKQVMMQELLTGKMRLVNPNTAVKAAC